MQQLKLGQQMPEFVFNTPFEKGLSFLEVANGKKTGLVFLRYYGCSLCQLDMGYFAEEYSKIAATGGQLLIVIQSDPDRLADELKKPNAFPYRIVCDPQQVLYEQFSIKPAGSREEMAGPNTMDKIKRAKDAGYQHGDYEGEELQLPAAFIVDENGIVRYAHYGKTVDDVPMVEELLKFF